MSEERWLPIPGYEGYYEVSDLGRVRSVPRIVPHAVAPLTIRGRIMCTCKSRGGHLRVTLARGGKTVTRSVHALVLAAFVGPRPEGLEGCHGDGDPSNNRLSNLRWDTTSNNHLDAVRHGTHSRTRRKKCPGGHDLRVPNLKPATLAKGRRQCLACSRAKGVYACYIRESRRVALPNLPTPEALADAYYEEIMGLGSMSLDAIREAMKPQICWYGHQLTLANLVPGKWKDKGHRSCLACARARTRVWKNPALDFETVADKIHAEIMAAHG